MRNQSVQKEAKPEKMQISRGTEEESKTEVSERKNSKTCERTTDRER